MALKIRPFEIQDYDAVLSLWRQCDGIGLSDADAPERIQTYLHRNPVMSFVALLGGRVVGAVLAGHDGRRGYIHHLAVHPDARRQGVGRKLVDHCLCALAADGIEKCHLFIFNHNGQGLAFWDRLGWRKRSDLSIVSKHIDPSI